LERPNQLRVRCVRRDLADVDRGREPKQRPRIDQLASEARLEVNMSDLFRIGRIDPNVGKALARDHGLADSHADRFEVSLRCGEPTTVIDGYDPAVRIRCDTHDSAGSRRQRWRALRDSAPIDDVEPGRVRWSRSIQVISEA
jgi:hypothetical protein